MAQITAQCFVSGFLFLGGIYRIYVAMDGQSKKQKTKREKERKKKNDRHLTSITRRRTENEDNIFIVEKCCRKVEEAAAECLR